MTKKSTIAAIQSVADATGVNNFIIALGSPGANLINSIGEKQSTARAWVPEPRSFPILIEGMVRGGAIARAMTSSGNLVQTDRRVELAGNNVVVTLPTPMVDFIGEYIFKATGTTGGSVVGTIDGAPVAIPLINWQYLRIYCDGARWLTG